MTDIASDSAIKPAATILILRDRPQFEVLMVRRHHQIDFASGALVFPGGKTHPGDDDPAWSDHLLGWNDFDPVQRGLRIASVRETFEEAGILLGKKLDGSPMAGTVAPLEVRQDVDAGRVAFLEVVKNMEVRLDLHALTVFARWITPPLTPKRFDTWFYVAHAPEDQLAACDGRETVDAEWIAPSEALRLGAEGKRTVIFPTRMNLQMLAEARDAEDCIARARLRPAVTVLPTIVDRAGERFLTLPKNAGYGEVEISLKDLN